MNNTKRYELMWKHVENEHGELSMRESFVSLTTLEWADKTMLENICKWLKDKMKIQTEYHSNVEISRVVSDFNTIEEMINELKNDLGNNEDN